MLDCIVANARVVDGTGAPWFRADLGIQDGRIAGVGRLDGVSALERIDAAGYIVAPGLIDVHIHSETQLRRSPVEPCSLYQGVTTHIVGQDGFGFAPSDEATLDFMSRYLRSLHPADVQLEPQSIADYLGGFDGAATVNVATLIPNGNVRLAVMGNTSRAATGDELEAMAELCRVGMREGAAGISSGLDYVPSGWASTEELVALSAAVAADGGVYVSHIRYRSGQLVALDEAIDIGRRAGVPVHISHLRPQPSEGVTAADLLSRIDDARGEGIDVTFDVYPYDFGCTFLLMILPPFIAEGGVDEIFQRLADPSARRRLTRELGKRIDGWSGLELAGELPSPYDRLAGTDILSAARTMGSDPVDFVCDLLVRQDLDVLMLGVEPAGTESMAGLKTIMSHPAHMFGSDSIFAPGRVHPRAFGSAAKFLGPLVREPGFLPLEEAVRHCTSFPARRFGLSDRGLIRPSFAADLVIFDPETLRDRASRTDRNFATGVRDVFVNGVAVLREGSPTGATPGRGLRHQSVS